MTLYRAALGTGFLFAMTTLGSAMVFFFVREPEVRFQKAMLGFAAGVMTAASVWSLLLPAVQQAEERGWPGWLPACAGMLAGCLFLAGLDAVLPVLRRERTQTSLLITAITLHNIPEGMAVGLACAVAGSGSAAGTAALMPWLLSFAAGAMLYVVADELIPQAQSRAGTCGYLLGFLLMMALDTALG